MAIDIVRAWKDPEYRKTLTPEELAGLPERPAGEISDGELQGVSGGSIVEDTEKIVNTLVKSAEKGAKVLVNAVLNEILP